jgi:hypothetical protein
MTSNPIQAMFEAGLVEQTDFPPESRYHGVAVTTLTRPDGTVVAYLRRRFPAPPEAFATLRERTVREGERLDQIVAAELGNPEAFWLLCDAAGALWAEELEVPGTRVRITLPEGVPGPGEDEL